MRFTQPVLDICYDELKSLAQKHGINIFGVADIRQAKQGFNLPPAKTQGLKYGLVLGKPLSHYVLATLKKGPNRLYLRHYLSVNRALDKVAHQLARFIASQGYRALPIPASRVINRRRLIGEASHRQLGYLAGLGWIGKSSLLINPRYGAQVRYVSILTNMFIRPDKPLTHGSCGKCRACINICPAQAIKERANDFDRQACYARLKEFDRQVGGVICGLCVKTCARYLCGVS